MFEWFDEVNDLMVETTIVHHEINGDVKIDIRIRLLGG
jgi:hypothetical protein